MGFGSFLKDILFPKSCFGCGRLGTYICFECSQKLQAVNHDRCVYCRKLSFMGFTHPFCKKPNGIDGVKSMFAYDALAKKVISRIKYTLVREAIAEFIISIPRQKQEEIKNFLTVIKSLYVVPVPLHQSRFAQRGFNQSEELARELSKFYDFSLDTTLTKRIRKTAVQARTTSYKERVANVRGAFAVSKTPSAKTIIIFDDVWTTGSTVRELTRTLKKEGVEKVYALTMAQAY